MRQGTFLGLAMLLAVSAGADAAELSRFRWERSDQVRYKVLLEGGREVSRLAYPPRAIPWKGLRGTAIEAMLEGGEDLLGRGNVEDARLLLEEALDQVRLGKESMLGMAEIELALAEVHRAAGDHTAAIQSLLKSLAIRKRRFGVDSIELMDPLEQLSKLYLDRKQPEKARPVMEWLRAIRRRRPEEWRSRSKVASSQGKWTSLRERVAARERAAMKAATAEAVAAAPDVRVVVVDEPTPTPTPTPKPKPKPKPKPEPKPPPDRGLPLATVVAALPDDPHLLQQAADRALASRDLKLADAVLDRLENALIQEHGKNSPERTAAWLGRAQVHELAGRAAEAAPLYEKILEIWAEQLGPEHPEVERIGVALADAYLDAGEYTLAEDYFWRAHSMRMARVGPGHPSTQRLVASLAYTFLRRGDLEQADKMATRALQALDRIVKMDHPLRAWPATVRGLVTAEQGDDVGARAHFEAALAATRASGERPGVELVRGFAALLRRAGESVEAQAFEALIHLPAHQP